MISLKASDLSEINWQGISEYTTQRGRVKAILTGIPGPRFWYSYKHHAEFKAQLRDAQVTVMRIGKGNWQVCLWINHRNQHIAEDLGYTVPAVAPETTAENPF